MDKKQRIIITMLELVVKQGVHATPMSQVAKEANVAVGTIYHYFENKNQIIEEIYMMIVKDYGVVLIANLPEGDFKKQYKTMWLNLYNYFVGNPLAYKFIEYVAVPPIISKEIVKQSIPYISNIRDIFLDGIKNKHLRDVPVKLMLQMTFGDVVSAVRLKIKEELEMANDHIDLALEMSWDSIKHKG
ncbi:TetR/AcrR family transcriptional regulator [Olleya aquimaris]|uniref:TetR/AcrR family transcriptional regulator n=1 Tax=Olleya sediminilitoris TaxID=2795739 RepID=A0ABS1WJ78_9FLAO|nr:TetR/AcrR family transcriptional regulator [Olleya sediminilitoris]AXO81263.1 TetR/AcrR family transcriptional regulator [Olleya aquimaris]MBL7559186.1 TetR/AcrR family transcriptional regulator [Olleya sediminilitoris]